jgi:hypothetical protein
MTPHLPARAETRTRAIAAPPSAVLDVISDPLRLPDWAPGFARSVTPEDGHWRIDGGGGELLVDMVVFREAGTVDVVRVGDETGAGARMRAIASGDGTELVFTIIFPPGVPDAGVDAQMAVVEAELATVAGLAEAAV